jgi:hypothetical protein
MSEKIKWCIATSDNLSYILKPYAWLMDKYLPEITDINILGYSVFPELPYKYDCVSLEEKQVSLDTWTRNLYNYFKYVQDEYVVFGLEDLLPIRSINYDTFEDGLLRMELDDRIGRYELGTGHCWHKKVVQMGNFYEYGYESLYRISTQTAIWRTEYLLQYLNNDWTPWQFEVEGSKIAQSDGRKVIASKFDFALEWVHSALSGKYPDMINVQGIQHSDVEEMIALGLLDRNKLQLGIDINSPRYE